ncbi:hypothetical protein [Streptomyces sp. SGAir0957]
MDDDETIEQLALSLGDLGWQEAGGLTTATVYSTGSDPVADAVAAANHIRRVLPHTIVERVDEQFVTLADIAARAGLTHEAVRLWATGKRRTGREPFPAARTQVGQGRSTSKIWAWPEVLIWLKEQYCLDLEPGVTYLDARHVARLNAALHEPKQQQWQRTSTAGVTRTLASLEEVLQENAPTARRFATRDTCP